MMKLYNQWIMFYDITISPKSSTIVSNNFLPLLCVSFIVILLALESLKSSFQSDTSKLLALKFLVFAISGSGSGSGSSSMWAWLHISLCTGLQNYYWDMC